MHVENEDLEMYILESLPLRDQAGITTHLGSCAACQGRLVESVRFAGKIAALKQTREKSGKDQRRFTRIVTDMAASIRVLSPVSSGKTQARVLDASREGLKLRVSEFLHPGATLQVRVTDTVAFGEVRYCQPAGSAFHVGVQIQDFFPAPAADSVQPKRKEPRSPVSAAASLRIEGGSHLQSVTVLDVSRSGLRVRSGTAVNTGSRVEVLYGNVTVLGEVRYARELAPDEFNIGVSADCMAGGDQVRNGDLDLTMLFQME